MPQLTRTHDRRRPLERPMWHWPREPGAPIRGWLVARHRHRTIRERIYSIRLCFAWVAPLSAIARFGVRYQGYLRVTRPRSATGLQGRPGLGRMRRPGVSSSSNCGPRWAPVSTGRWQHTDGPHPRSLDACPRWPGSTAARSSTGWRALSGRVRPRPEVRHRIYDRAQRMSDRNRALPETPGYHQGLWLMVAMPAP
jgi:hypothetical protein